MRIHDLEQPATRLLAPATPRRHGRAVLLGAGALALALAAIGMTAALTGWSSPATRAHAQSLTVAGKKNISAASFAKRQSSSGQVAANSTTSRPASPVLADGTYPAYVQEVDIDGAAITLDVVQVFENDAAAKAAAEDGMAPGEAQYLYIYIRNQNPRLRTVPVARHVRIQFADGCEAPSNRGAALSELAKQTKLFDKLYYYEIRVAKGAIRQIKQRLAEAAC